jgi:drug/metabolite transporter (DMT)-like permease
MVGTGSYFLLRIGNQPGHALLLSVLFAFLAALIGGTLDIVARHYNDRLYRYFAQGKYRLSTVHLFGLVTAFIRGLCIFLPFFLIARIITAPSYFPYMSRTFFMIVSIGVGIANALYLFRKQSTLVYICLGGLCGLALLVF